ncbi:MAG: MdtA/MuxA family multidrug efflux RND transporter periplasmic adaptor subunit [Rhodocyclaceae bacterium]|nr:MdtA/MuxA family multidrug efflux RND transporter periplasmic adaptor subunit [Rhodocyclaceae bacterium]
MNLLSRLSAQLKKPRFGKISLRLILIILLIATAVGAGIWYLVQRQGDAKSGPGGFGGRGGFGGARVQPVSAGEVKIMDVPLWVNAIGTLIPRNLVTVRSRVDGELMKLHFTEGQMVKAGDLLAQIDPRPLEVQLTQANGQMARDSAQLKNAQLDLERYRTLLAKDAISRQQADTQEALVRQYQGTVEVDRGVVANAQLQLSYARITAPVSGRVGLRQVDPGNQVKSGDTNGIVIIAQVQPITAVFSVPEINLPLVSRALTSKEPTTVELWDREFKHPLATGKLLTADNQIDTATGTLKLKAEFRNEDGTLFPNQFVNVKLSAGTATDAKVVPGSAVLRGAKGSFVYVIGPDDKVSAVQVTAGAASGDLVVIEGGIEAGVRVVTDGADKLRDGAQVEVISAEARQKAVSSDGTRRGKRGQNGQGGSAATNARSGDGKSSDAGMGKDAGPSANGAPRSPEEWKKRKEAREAAQQSGSSSN